MSRRNEWFLPGAGIAREVITADIQRYLGNDALVRPGDGTGEHQGQKGYWITAYRTLTTPMIEDLKRDSQSWQQERPSMETGRGGGGRGAAAGGNTASYYDSQTHASRQHWGPSQPYDTQHQSNAYAESPHDSSAQSRSHGTSASYANSEPHYTTTPTPQHVSSSAYQGRDVAAAPRTAPTEQFSPYQQSSRQDTRDTRDYSNQHAYGYQGQAPAAYGRPTAPATNAYAASSLTAAPGYYFASDGRQYPLPQQPTPPTARNPPPGGTRYSAQR